MKLELARGVRDINPEEQMLREEIKTKLISIFNKYGFVPLDTPILERYDVLSAKFAAGDESDAMQETYTLQDNGGRELGLRFDLTVPLARYVGMNRTLKMPFKRYQIGKVYRDAPVKLGRYREFTQCDVDIVGSKDMISDATCIMVAKDSYKEFGIDVRIKVNNRKFLIGLMESNDISQEKANSLIMTIDKLDKIGVEGVLKEAQEKGFSEDVVKKIVDMISMKGSTSEKLKFFKNILPENEGLKELEELFSYFKGQEDIIEFSPILARGLGYYTATVYEIYDKEGRLDSAIGAGGRYDKMIGSYLSGNSERGTEDRQYPAVGISFGLDRIVDVLKKLELARSKKTRTTLFIVPLGTKQESFEIAERFRQAGINTDIDMIGRGPSKNFKNANQQEIPYVAVIGEDELAENVISLKELATGTEEKMRVEEAIEKLSSIVK
ncbi:MAG: histidine--tRNA ligase [Candidatus Woesearchaeota archaeon]